MYDVFDVANFFLHKESMSPKKLQKLLYYAYAWTLALLNETAEAISFKLFNDKIEAWVHGPVVPNVYGSYKEYGWNSIPQIADDNSTIFAAEVLDILEQVWGIYGKYTGNQLEEICHHELPWQMARNGVSSYLPSDSVLSDETIFTFYNDQANA